MGRQGRRQADAVVFPGAMFGPRGAAVHRHSWSRHPPKPFQPDVEGRVHDEVSPLLDAVGGSTLLIAKSLGTNAAALAAERGLPGVWLTPILTAPWVAAALSRATAPFLLVGGTAGAMWDAALARRLSPHVLEAEDAGHGM
jgi:hypothetical protein